jgi:hypothetical protein
VAENINIIKSKGKWEKTVKKHESEVEIWLDV